MSNAISTSKSSAYKLTINGEIVENTTTNSGELDGWRVDLQAGTPYTFRLDSSDALLDPYLRLMGSDGSVIVENDNAETGSINSLINYTPSASGTYFLSSKGAPLPFGSGNAAGALGTGSDDFLSSIHTSGRLAVGGRATGTIETIGDTDWFKISLAAGQVIRLDMEGSGSSKGTLYDPYIRGVYTGNGTLVTYQTVTDDDHGVGYYNASLTFTANQTGDYFIAAGAYHWGNDWEVGTYQLSATSLTNVPVLSISSAAANSTRIEGNTGSTPFTFSVNRSNSVGVSTVTYTVSGAGNETTGSASADDFLGYGGTLPTGLITFADGETVRTITINVAGDTVAESNERFKVELSNPVNGILSSTASSNYGLISNDDAGPTLNITSLAADTTKNEGNTASTPFTFKITRTNGIGTTTVNYTVRGAGDSTSTAASESDFLGYNGILPSGSVTFSPNQLVAYLTINVAGDIITEDRERFAVTLSNPYNGTVSASAGTAFGVILNDDHAAAPEVSVLGNGVSIVDDDATPSTSDFTNFGNISQAATSGLTRTFTVKNTGTAALTTSSLTATGDFVITEGLSSTIAANSSDTFTVRMDTTTAGAKTGQISFYNNDSGEGLFNFAISGAATTPTDAAGATNALARNIGTLSAATQTFTDFVGTADANDFYKFTLSEARGLQLTLSGLSADADVVVYESNGISIVGSGVQSGSASETISIQSLAAGTYYVQVKPGASTANTNYSLALSAPAIPAPEIAVLGLVNGNIADNTTATNTTVGTNFGTAEIDTTYATRTFTVKNTGNANLTTSNLTVTGDFSLVGGENLATVITPGSSDTITVRMNTSTSGAKTGQIAFNNNDKDEGNYNFAISGTVVAPVDSAKNTTSTARNLGTLTATSQATYSDYVGNVDPIDYYKFALSETRDLRVTLTGLSADADVRLYSSNGTNEITVSNFGGTHDELIDYPALAAGTYYLAVFPGVTNAKTNYTMGLTAAKPDLPEIDVFGNGVSISDGSASPLATNSTAFGTVALNSVAPERTFTIKNTGSADLILTASSVPEGFTIVDGIAGRIRPGESDAYTVKLNTTTAGTKTGKITISSNDLNESTFDFTVSGTVSASTDAIGNTAATAYNFGALSDAKMVSDSIGAGDAKDYYKFSLASTRKLSVVVSGLAAGDTVKLLAANGTSELDSWTTTTSTSVQTFSKDALVAGSYYLLVQPGSSNSADRTYTLIASAPLPMTSEISVSGAGYDILNNDLAPRPEDQTAFNSMGLNARSPNHTFTIKNTGGTDLSISNFRISPGFTVVDELSSSIAPYASDNFTIQLDTTTPGVKTGQISFDTNDQDESKFKFAVSGTVTSTLAPEVAVVSGNWEISDGQVSASNTTNFGINKVGNSPTNRTFTVLNLGTAALTTSGLAAPTGFSVVEGLSSTIAPGSSDEFTVRMDTTTAGAKTGQVSFQTNDADEKPFNFAVNGEVQSLASFSIEPFAGESNIKYEGSSSETTFTYVIRRSDGIESSSVKYIVSGVSDQTHGAMSENDFKSVSFIDTITFNDKEYVKPITITINNDLINEPNEAFSVQLIDPSNATLNQQFSTAYGFVNDDDTPLLESNSILTKIFYAVGKLITGNSDTGSLSIADIKNIILDQYNSGSKYWLTFSHDIDGIELASLGLVPASFGPEVSAGIRLDLADLLGVTPEGRDGRVTAEIDVGLTLLTAGLEFGSDFAIIKEDVDYRGPDGTFFLGGGIEIASVSLANMNLSAGTDGVNFDADIGFQLADVNFASASVSVEFEYDWQFVSSAINRISDFASQGFSNAMIVGAFSSSLILGVPLLGVRGFTSSDGLEGTNGNDTIVGSNQDDMIIGLGGNDLIYGYAGSNSYEAGFGDDTIVGSIGNDIYRYFRDEGNDVIYDDEINSTNILEIYDNASILDLDNFNDLRFSKNGNELLISLDIQEGFFSDSNSGSIKIKTQSAINGVDWLRVFDDDGELINGIIDLHSVWSAASSSLTTLNFTYNANSQSYIASS